LQSASPSARSPEDQVTELITGGRHDEPQADGRRAKAIIFGHPTD